LEDGASEEVDRLYHPYFLGDERIREDMQDAGKILGGASCDGNTVKGD